MAFGNAQASVGVETRLLGLPQLLPAVISRLPATGARRRNEVHATIVARAPRREAAAERHPSRHNMKR